MFTIPAAARLQKHLVSIWQEINTIFILLERKPNGKSIKMLLD